MSKVRASEIAKELGIKSKDVLDKAKDLGIDIKTASSAVSEEEAAELAEYILTGRSKRLEATNKETPVVKKEKKSKESNEEESVKATAKKTSPKDKKSNKDSAPKPMKKSEVAVENPNDNVNNDKNPKEPVANVFAETKLEEQAVELPPNEVDEDDKKESLAQATVQKRVGLRIVKKRSDDIVPKNESSKDESNSASQAIRTLQSLLGDKNDSEQPHKKKKDKKKSHPVASHKKNEQKIDLLGDRNLDTIGDFDDEQDEVMLFDLTIREDSLSHEEEVAKKVDTDRIQVHKKTPFLEQGIRRAKRKKSKPKIDTKQESISGTIEIPEEIRAYEFADRTNKSIGEVIKVLFNLGLMITKNDFLDRDSIEILAEELGLDIVISNTSEALEYTSEEGEDSKDGLEERPPVVTIMGHVDHGKTSLLDRIRDTRVAAGEAGGITQHIGAYTVEKNGKKISFIDTPGHEAFTEMRARGAGITDIVIIVIAADDGVKQQTIEALNHAKAANVPIIIALNKIDKPDANLDKVKAEASDLGYSPLEWGGEYEFVHISARTGEGIDHLLETILVQSELLELKANPNKPARAVVIESSLEKGKGPVATVIVQNGTLRIGDSIVADTAHGRVRALSDDCGKGIQSIGPSEVAVVTGLSEAPMAGAVLVSVESDSIAREYAEKRISYLRQKELSRSTKVSFDELSAMVAEGQLKSLPVIIKADTQGSLEAIRGSLEKLRNEEVKINIIHSGVGGITESDVILTGASDNSIILGFNVRPTGSVKNKAKELGVEIKTYSIIYALLDDIKALLSGMMSPILEEENTGQAEVRDTFSIAKVGTIAGCYVTDGSIQRGIKARLIRNGVVVFTGNIASLKRFKDDAREVAKGYECGIMLEGFNDIQVGDVFETYKEIERARKI
ncbi:MAG: translation initiation factor IF-2 [Wolinella sp.]